MAGFYASGLPQRIQRQELLSKWSLDRRDATAMANSNDDEEEFLLSTAIVYGFSLADRKWRTSSYSDIGVIICSSADGRH